MFRVTVDDSTGVMTCVLWLNDYNQKRRTFGMRKEDEIRTWMSTNQIGPGDTLSILGALEEFKEKKQINVHKMRLIRDSSEEMLQY